MSPGLFKSALFYALALLFLVSESGCGGNEVLNHVTSAPSQQANGADTNTKVTLPVAKSKVDRLTLAIDRDFPDPGGLIDQGVCYAYATNGDGSNVRTAQSTDFVNWQLLPDALPTLPTWAQGGLTWAPDVIKVSDHLFVMYFTARQRASGKQCVGLATSQSAAGPFTSPASAPFVCQISLGGTIDAAAFKASDGRLFLLYKNDGNCCGFATRLWGRQLGADGQSWAGDEVQLLAADQSWEGNLVEAPAMFEEDGRFFLFYSCNNYANTSYSTGVAVATSPLGPFTKTNQGKFLLSNPSQHLIGPGGLTPIKDSNGFAYAFFHNWNDTTFKYRSFWIAPLTFQNGQAAAQIASP